MSIVLCYDVKKCLEPHFLPISGPYHSMGPTNQLGEKKPTCHVLICCRSWWLRPRKL